MWAIGFLVLPRPALAKTRFRLHQGAQSEPTKVANKAWGTECTSRGSCMWLKNKFVSSFIRQCS